MKYLFHMFINSKTTERYSIGFVVPRINLYKRVMPSTRIRVYDIINAFKNNDIFHLELFKKRNNYQIVIFQKHFNKNAYNLAQELKKRKTKIVLDINVNYLLDDSKIILNEQRKDFIRFIKICDAVIVSSIYLKNFLSNKINIPFFLIEENINRKYFKKRKVLKTTPDTLIWSGFSVKAKEILTIKDVLENLSKKYNLKLIIIAEKNPKLKINNLKIEYLKYNEKKITSQLLKGDIFIAPRNLNEKYNLGHSFTKIGVAMAMGIPVVASPIPSYLKSPAIISFNNKEWENNLKNLLRKNIDIKNLSEKGIEYCKVNYDIEYIKNKYLRLFNNLINENKNNI